MKVLEKDYNSLVKNTNSVLLNDIEFIDETFSGEYYDDRLYVNYHSLDIEILKDNADLYLSLDLQCDIHKLYALLDIIRFRISYLNLSCKVYIEDKMLYLAISENQV
jgi:hypothetical protein